MKRKMLIAPLLLATVSLLFIPGIAQTPQEQPRPGMMGGGMMGQMMTHHQQMTGLMNKLTQSMTAIQSEKDPAALKAQLAEHRALLDQMRSHMMQQGNMMQGMTGQVKNCPGIGTSEKPAAK